MRLSTSARLAALALLPASLMVAGSAGAATLNLSDTITYPGSVTVTSSGLPGNGTITPTATFDLGHTLPGSLGYFPTNLVSGSSSTGPSNYNFYDDYLFSTTGATVSGAVISFDQGVIGVGHLQARLIRTDSGANPVPTLGLVANSTLVVDKWTDVSCAPNVNCQIILPNSINSGSYDLQIRGGADALGGSYGGNLQFTAVPLPAAAWLLISGLGGLGSMARRRKPA